MLALRDSPPSRVCRGRFPPDRHTRQGRPPGSVPCASVIEVRARAPQDLPRLCEVLSAQAEASRYPIRWPWSEPVEAFIVRRNEEQAWTAVLADEPDRPVGHVSVVKVVDDVEDGIASGFMAATGAPCEDLACISVLFVDQDSRGAGVGTALLDTATEWIAAHGRIPVLDVVSIHEQVIDMYRRRGWRVAGEAHPFWLPEASLVLMVLDGA
jgi:GNAT superfamily N-acetyltransferase